MKKNRLGRKRQQYVKLPMPDFLEFQHPRLVSEPPGGGAWIHEIKFDGYRLQVRIEGGRATIFTRNGHDWTGKFPELSADLATLPDCILDGELCALDANGHPNFSKLRASISPGKTSVLVYFAFDLLWANGEDLRPFALLTRKAELAKLFDAAHSKRLRYVDHFEVGGPNLLLSACRMTLEGIVSKRRDATYKAGRSEVWLKSKCRPGQEVVIGGWVQEPGRAFKSLLVGVYDDGALRYAGSVKTGFGRGTERLLPRLKELETQAMPFAAGDPPRKTSEIHWTRPELVANVEIAEWTASGKLRQCSFKGLRDDKRPQDVERERPAAGRL